MPKLSITKQMKIEEVIKKHPETLSVFAKYGFHCVGCVAASFESIEDGAKTHGITPEELIGDLNNVIRKQHDQ